MTQTHRIAGLYLMAVALAVAVQFVLESTYASASPTPAQVWRVLDWFSLAGFALCCIFNFAYMRAMDEVWGRIASGVAFYASVVLTLAFIHNFVASLASGSDDILFWKFINAAQVPLFAATGARLYRH